MGFRFRKSVKIAPGVKLNINKNSVGITAGTKGAHYSVNSSGRKTASVGIPGTGISYVTTSGSSSGQHHASGSDYSGLSPELQNSSASSGSPHEPFYQKTWFVILMMFCCCFPVGLFLMWKYKKFNKPVRIIISSFFALCFVIGLFTNDESSSVVETTSTVVETTSAIEETVLESETTLPETTVAESSIDDSVSESSFDESTTSEVTASEPVLDSSSSIDETAALVADAPVSSSESQEETVPETVAETESIEETTVAPETTYIVNTNTGKFHYPSCSGAAKIKAKNRKEVTGTRDELAQKYDPCKICKP